MIFSVFSTMAITWIFASYSTCVQILNLNLANLLLGITAGALVDRVGAAVIFVGLTFAVLYFLLDISSLIIINGLQPMGRYFLEAQRSLKSAHHCMTQEEVARIVKEIALFEDVSRQTIDLIVQNGQLKKYRKGARLIIQGAPAKQAFVLLKGQVRVDKHEGTGRILNLARLNAPTIFGEQAMIDNSVHTADVIVVTPVVALVVKKSDLDKIRKSLPADYKSISDRILLQQGLASSPLFSSLPKEMSQLFLHAGSMGWVPKGRPIVKEGQTGDAFYILVRGTAGVEIGKKKVGTIGQGGFFGEISLLTGEKRNATVSAATDCVLFKIPSRQFWEIISQNIELAMNIEMTAEGRLQKDKKLARRAS